MQDMESKMRSDDRELVLKPKEGLKPKDSIGMADPRLFTGDNKLRAVFEGHTCLWYLKYDKGALPEPLRDKRYTTFNKAKDAAENYFNRRNMEIVKVND